MRIVAGAWRGRGLTAPPGSATRPTADRVRQALFDMLMHAPWAGADAVRRARVLDGFAGSGALGLEALSRGASEATFVERDRAALACLQANIAACRAAATVVAGDLLAITPGPAFSLIFLDPPYGMGLVARAVASLRTAGRIAPHALLVVETACDETLPDLAAAVLAERRHGAARLTVLRAPGP